jgi:DNA-binding GntR family transcriptional regulator
VLLAADAVVLDDTISERRAPMRAVLRDHARLPGAIRQYKEVEVTILAPEEARLLQSNPGAPALLISYLSHSQTDGTPVEFRRMVVRGDRC